MRTTRLAFIVWFVLMAAGGAGQTAASPRSPAPAQAPAPAPRVPAPPSAPALTPVPAPTSVPAPTPVPAQTPAPAPTPAPTPTPAVPAAPAPQRPAARPQPPQRPTEPAPPEAPRRERAEAERVQGQPVNIRVDVTIIDEGGPQPSRKTVSVTVGDRQSGQVRSAVAVPGIGHVPLALDVLPVLERDGKIRTRITLEYQPNPGQDRKEPTPVEMRLSFGVILESGQKIVAAQAADPVTDRRVSAEVTATVLK